MSWSWKGIVVSLSALLIVGLSPPVSAIHEDPIVGTCEVAIRVDRSLNGFALSMDEPAPCDTTDGNGTLELSGEAEGEPGLTCAGGFADGRASLTLTTPSNVEHTDIADLKLASKAGAVTVHARARNANEDILLGGELLQSHTVVSTCLNNATPVFWHGHLVVQAQQIVP